MVEHAYLAHPVLVHFTVALLATSVFLHFLARFVGSEATRLRLAAAAELNLWIGAAITALTVGAGMIAFGTAPQSKESQHLVELHRDLAYGTFVLFAVLASISAWPGKRARAPGPSSWSFLAALAIAFAALTATGLVGGHIVYSEGVGIEKANPKPDASHP